MGRSKQFDIMRARGFIGVHDAASAMGVTPTTIYRMLDEGVLKELRVGNKRYIEVKSLVAHLGTDAAKALGLVA